LGLFRIADAGTRFDATTSGSRRINGVRNFRQALASPHPAVRFHDSARPYELGIWNSEFSAHEHLREENLYITR
jgi:hypothetical protein